MSKEVYAAVTPPFVGLHKLRLAEFREFLDAFLEHGEFTAAEDPDRKSSNAMLARVHDVKDDFWDFRVTAPHSGIRAFGGFAAFDTFVVLTWEYREMISDFDAEVAACKEEWHRLFGPITPMKKGHLNEYISNYIPV
ncbi:MAG: hypothetical protein NTV97_04610 [Alphaproteobacteria bacterium]|nr:hypothetical protein [Alphaproteobacteria bacterium]